MRWMSPHDLAMWNFRKNVFAGRSSHIDHHGLIPRLLSSSTVINNTSSANPQILQNWGNGWHPKWPGFNPDQPRPKEKCKFLHRARITSTEYQYSEEWTGRAHSCWKWAHRGCLAESKPALHSRHRADQTHTEHYSQTSTWRAILLFSAQLWWAIFTIQSSFGTTSTKGMWRNWKWSTGEVPNWLPREHDLQGGWRKQGLCSLAQRSLSMVEV